MEFALKYIRTSKAIIVLICSGKISPAQKKMAQKWIEKNHELIVSKWNEFSNGFEIEVA